jgi:hypothetical protein
VGSGRKHFSVEVGYGGYLYAWNVAGCVYYSLAFHYNDEWPDCLLYSASSAFAFACADIAAFSDTDYVIGESEAGECFFDFFGFS